MHYSPKDAQDVPTAPASKPHYTQRRLRCRHDAQADVWRHSIDKRFEDLSQADSLGLSQADSLALPANVIDAKRVFAYRGGNRFRSREGSFSANFPKGYSNSISG